MSAYFWVACSLWAAFFQTLRIAGQKQLCQYFSSDYATWIRFLFSLPWITIGLVWLVGSGVPIPYLSPRFLLLCLATALCQLIATRLQVALFSRCPFVVGITYVRSEAIQTAILGIVLFNETLSWTGALAILIVSCGLLSLSLSSTRIKETPLKSLFQHDAILIGLAAGTGFALASLFARTASLSLASDHTLMRSFVTLVLSFTLQTILFGGWILWRERSTLPLIAVHWRTCCWVGWGGAMSSMGWYTAFVLAKAAYVNALGQIELLFALWFGGRMFKESLPKRDRLSIAVIVGGIVLLLVRP